MRILVMLGVVLMIVGALALAYQGFSYTKREKVVDVGPIQATAEQRKRVAVPPIVGGTMLAGGIVLVIVGLRRRTG